MGLVWGMLDRLITGLGFVALTISAATTVVIAGLGAADVVSSNLFNRPIAGTFEVSGTLLAVMIFLGLAYAQRMNEHVAVDVLVAGAPLAFKRFSLFLSLLLGAVVFGMLAWRGLDLALASVRIREVATGQFAFPIYPAKLAMVFGCAVASLECIRQLVLLMAGRLDPVEQVPEDAG